MKKDPELPFSEPHYSVPSVTYVLCALICVHGIYIL